MADSRVNYVLNGYKEGFGKHSKYPSFPKNLISLGLDFMHKMDPDETRKWVKDNQNLLVPLRE